MAKMHFVPEDVDVGGVGDSTPDVGMCHTHRWHHTLNVSIQLLSAHTDTLSTFANECPLWPIISTLGVE